MISIFDTLLANEKYNEAAIRTDKNDQTALHFICENGREECLIKMLDVLQNTMHPKELKSYINARDKDGNTALHIATDKQQTIIIELLQLYGANKSIANNNNEIVESISTKPPIGNIKCGDKNKMKKLIKKLTMATHTSDHESDRESSSFSNSENDDNIVLSNTNDKKGNIVSNFFKRLISTQIGGNDTDTDDLISRIKNKLEMTGGATSTKKSTTKKSTTKKSTTKKVDGSKSTTKKVDGSKSTTKKVEGSKSTTKKVDGSKSDNYISKYDGKNSNKREFTSSEIHEQVIVMIQDLGYSFEEAKIIKAGLYRYTKNEHPELNSYDRALKMKQYTTEQHIANIDIMAIKQAIDIHYQQKEKN